jgi:hypothetical protein
MLIKYIIKFENLLSGHKRNVFEPHLGLIRNEFESHLGSNHVKDFELYKVGTWLPTFYSIKLFLP